MRTTDSGNNWTINSLGTNYYYSSVYFPDENTGYVSSGSIFKTTNGRLNWFFLSSQVGGIDISFINANTGFIAGPGNLCYGTTNGGMNWIFLGQFIINDNPRFYSVKFIDENTGFLGGISTKDFLPGIFFDVPTIYKTTNGGNNWIRVYSPGFPTDTPKVLYSISFSSSETVLAVGELGKITKTTSMGSVWTDQVRMTSNTLYCVYSVSNSLSYISGDSGIIFMTSNGGSNWNRQNSNIKTKLNAITFIDSLNGYSVGEYGVILKTTTGGVTFIKSYSDKIPEEFSIAQNYPNPFNPVTHLEFGQPVQAGISNSGFVSLKVFNLSGKEVAALANERKSPGIYEVEFDGSNFPSGVYLYRLQVDGNVIGTKRMVLIK